MKRGPPPDERSEQLLIEILIIYIINNIWFAPKTIEICTATARRDRPAGEQGAIGSVIAILNGCGKPIRTRIAETIRLARMTDGSRKGVSGWPSPITAALGKLAWAQP
jgi:hypothetical protein